MSLALLRVSRRIDAAYLVAPVYSAPINITDALITSNGSNVFEGNWENTSYSSNNGAAVYVTTTQPVIIQNSRFKAQKHCVQSLVTGTQITVRNCVGVPRNTGTAGSATGRFLSLWEPAAVVCENNTMVGSGVYIAGAGSNQTTSLSIRYNRALNINGMYSDGAGGYVFERANVINTYYTKYQIAQINGVPLPNGGEIAWNEVINDPFVSRIEDTVNLSNAVGNTGAGGMLKIHDNYFQGGFPTRPYDVGYSGGGIVTEGTTQYIDIDDNQIVGYDNIGIGIAGGSRINIRRNRLVSAGNAYGRAMLARNRAAYSTDAGATYIVWQDNAYSWMDASNNQAGLYITNAGNTGNVNTGWTSLGSPTTEAHEAAEWEYWRAKVAAAGVRLGSTLAV